MLLYASVCNMWACVWRTTVAVIYQAPSLLLETSFSLAWHSPRKSCCLAVNPKDQPPQYWNSKSTGPCPAFFFHVWGCVDSSTYACKAGTLLTDPIPHPYSSIPVFRGTMILYSLLCHVPCPGPSWKHNHTIILTSLCYFCLAQSQNSQNSFPVPIHWAH